MEKSILAWDQICSHQGPVHAFAVHDDFCLVSFITGRVEVLGKFSFDVQIEPVYSILHLRQNIFGICQSVFTVVEIQEDCYKVLKTVKDRVLGCYEDVFWTKYSVLDENFKSFYMIGEIEGEIVQVCKVAGLVVVSSLVRTVILGKERVIQVGKKERNGAYGACGYMNSVYAARPLGNLWQANFEGVVMITTSYKVNSEKVNFGSIFKLGKFLLSFSKKHSNFIVIDPTQQLIVHYEKLEEGFSVFLNQSTNTLYKLGKDGIYKAVILTISQFFHRLLIGDTNEAVKFVLNNSELHNLTMLEPLCVQVFYEKKKVDEELFEQFCAVIKELEENMDLPEVKVQKEELKNDELFDEFLRLSSMEKGSKGKGRKKKVDRRIQKYLQKDFVWEIILNWLMFVLYKRNDKLFRVRGFLRIAERSLDYEKFSILVQEEKTIVQQIETTL